MTNLEHAEISRRLASALGWPTVKVHAPTQSVWVRDSHQGPAVFDYRDPVVIWPIAEQFDAFPGQIGNDSDWDAYSSATDTDARAGTAALAVALAVIKAKESK